MSTRFSFDKLSALSSVAAGGTLKAGDIVDFVLTTELQIDSVAKGPNDLGPVLALNNGSQAVYTGFDAAGLHFRYIVQASDSEINNTSDLKVNGLYLNGGSIGHANYGGTTSFEPIAQIKVAGRPFSVAAADFNNDGLIDLLTANDKQQNVSVIFNASHSGVFDKTVKTIELDGTPVFVTTGDFNRDGYFDFITANESESSLTLFMNNMNGGFSKQNIILEQREIDNPYYDPQNNPDQPKYLTQSSSPNSIAISDVNEDGYVDIITANAGSDDVTVLLGDALGNYAKQTRFGAGSSPNSVASGDINGDGHVDLAVANQGEGSVSVLLGDGKGNFTALADQPVRVGLSPDSVAIADVNGDSKLDLITANFGSKSVSIAYNSKFNTQGFEVGPGPTSGRVADINGDSYPDIFTSNFISNTVSVLLGDPNNRYDKVLTLDALPRTGEQRKFYVADPRSIISGDFNQDGKVDLAVAYYGTGDVLIFNNTSSSFSSLDPSGVSLNLGLAVDATIPTVTITTPVAGDNRLNKAEAAQGLTVSGTTTGAESGQVVTVKVLDAASAVKGTFTQTLTNGGTWSVAMTPDQAKALADGSYTIQADVTDKAGNAAVAAITPLFVDLTPPAATVALTLVSDTGAKNDDGITKTTTPTLTGSAEAGSIVTLKDGGTVLSSTISVDDNGAWSYTLTQAQALSEGSHSFTATATDAAQNVGAASPVLSVIVDQTAPTIALNPITGDDRINANESRTGYVIAGTTNAEVGQTVTVTIANAGGTLATETALILAGANGTNTFSAAIDPAGANGQTLADGSYTVSAAVSDLAGNAAIPTTTTLLINTFVPGPPTPSTNPNQPTEPQPPTGPSAEALMKFGMIVTDPASPAGQIYGLYEALLNRAPDPLGLESFTTALQNGASLVDVANALLASPERGMGITDPTAFVQSLYQNLLNRPADASGLATFTNELANGVSPATVAVQLATSAEAQALLAPTFASGVFVPDASESSVARLYYGLLGRAPDAGGLVAFSNFIETSGGGAAGEMARLGQVAETIILSNEFMTGRPNSTDQAFINGLYSGALGRAPDAGGQALYLDQLAHGVSRATVALEIAQSPEAQIHLVSVIQDGALLVA